MSNRKLQILTLAGIAASALLAAASSHAQQAEETVVRRHISITQADTAAATSVKSSYYHVMAAGAPGARERAAALNGESERQLARMLPNEESISRTPTPEVLASPFFFPADLKSGGGITLKTTVSHAIYVDYTGTIAANWGNPEGFLTDLGKSTFIHLSDQYTGVATNGRYTVGANASVSYGFFGNTLYEHELWAIVHAVAAKDGRGTGHLYHIFLPKGLDTCFEQSGSCYSPDNSNTFAFCAYHSSVTFSDIGQVFYTVEPFQMVPGCQVATPSPNGQLADSTNSVLSHEFFEAVTDPAGGTGFINRISLDLRGYEIGDECQPLVNSSSSFLVPTFLINGKKYEVQLEYSNTYHACAQNP